MQKLRTIEEWMRDKERDAAPAARRRLAGVPAKYHDMTWRDYEETAETKHGDTLKGILQEYSDDWTVDTSKGITVIGPPGYGKTCGMGLLACELIDAGAWVRWTGWSELTQRKRRLIDLARVAEQQDDWGDHEKEELAIRRIERDCDVLFLDDVGKEYRHASKWSDAELDNLLRTRDSSGKVTMVTSNLKWGEFAKYNDSMVSFLREMGEVVIITVGVDHRDVEPPRLGKRRARE